MKPQSGIRLVVLLVLFGFVILLGKSITDPAIASAAPPRIYVGGCAVVTGANSAGGLRVRSGPGTNYTQVGTIYDGTVVRITGGPASGSGYTWWQHDHGGWSAANWLADSSCGGSGNIQLVEGLRFNPSSPQVNQSTNAYYRARNNGSASITFGHLGVKCRRNSDQANYDYYWYTNVTLSPGQEFTYDANRSFDTVTSYWCTPNYEQGGNWNDVKWSDGSTNYVTVNVQNTPSPGNIQLVEGLRFSPSSPQVNQSTNAYYRARNNGGQSITLGYIGVKCRRNSDQANYDYYWYSNVTLAPGQEFTNDTNRSFDTAGSYWCTPNYEQGGNWNDVKWSDGSTNYITLNVQNVTPPGNIYVASDIELEPSPYHSWPPIEGDRLIGRFTLGNNGGQTLHLNGYGIRMRRNSTDYWDFLNTNGIDLAPGQTVRFDQNNERPLATGHYRAEITWQVAGQDWQVTSAREFDVSAPAPVDNASLINQPGSPTVQANQGVQIVFELQNTGGTTWSNSGGYYLANVSNPLGAPNRIDLGNSVAPQQTYRWVVNVVAPGSAGTYRTEWRMMHNGSAFGPLLSVDINVSSPPSTAYDLRVTSAIVLTPSAPSIGQAVTAQYTVHNFGSQTAYLRLLGVGGRGPNGDGDIQDYPWYENISIAPGADFVVNKSRGFTRAGVYTFFPVYQLSNGVWQEVFLQSGASARKSVNVSGTPNPGLVSFDIKYLDKSREVMFVETNITSYPADGSIVADVSVRNTTSIPTMMSVVLLGNVSQASGYLEKAARIDTIPIGPKSTVTFHDVRFYPGSDVQFRFAPFGYGSSRDTKFLAGFHLTEILTIAVLGFTPSGDLWADFNGLLDGQLDIIGSAMDSVNIDWYAMGIKLGRGDIWGAIKDLPGIAENYSEAIANLSGEILKSPLPATGVKTALKSIAVFLRLWEAKDYLKDLYAVQSHYYSQADIIPSSRPGGSRQAVSVRTAQRATVAVDPANLAAAANGASVIATSSEHTAGWEQHWLIDGDGISGWGTGVNLLVGEWNTIRLANKTPALISTIAINPGPVGGDTSGAALKDFHVDASIDGVNFTTVLRGSFTAGELGQTKTFSIQSVVAEYIRVVADSNQGNGTPNYVDIAQLDVRGTTYSPDDAYEPDATFAQGSLINTEGVSQRHSFNFPGDSDWIRFWADANTTYLIKTSDLASGSDTVLELYQTDGTTRIAYNDDSNGTLASRIVWTSTDAGYYFARVRHYSPSASGPSTEYGISVLQIPSGGSQVSGAIKSNGNRLSGIPVELRYYDGTGFSSMGFTTTGTDGYFAFRSVGNVPSGNAPTRESRLSQPKVPAVKEAQVNRWEQRVTGRTRAPQSTFYYVRFVNTFDNPNYLWFWGTGPVYTINPGSSVSVGEFDITNVPLGNPNAVFGLRFPVVFNWTQRINAGDTDYWLEMFGTNGEYFRDGGGLISRYTLSALPNGFTFGPIYGWDVEINNLSTGGYGYSYQVNSASFSQSTTDNSLFLPFIVK